MSHDPDPCGKWVFATPGRGPYADVPPNRAERRRQIRLKLARKCALPAGHSGECAP